METRSKHALLPLLYYKYRFDGFQSLLHLTSCHTLCPLKSTRCTTRSNTAKSDSKEKGNQKEGHEITSHWVSQDTTCSQERTSGKGAIVARGAIVAIGTCETVG